jgi:hypothetical protein
MPACETLIATWESGTDEHGSQYPVRSVRPDVGVVQVASPPTIASSKVAEHTRFVNTMNDLLILSARLAS